jgi:hypothetical protein
MRITNEGTEYSIKTPRYRYFRRDGVTLFPESVVFKATFIGNSNIQDLRFEDWLGRLLHNKIVTSLESPLEEEEVELLRRVSPLADPFLTVNSTDKEYILETFYTIINSLLPEGSTLKSLEWKK